MNKLKTGEQTRKEDYNQISMTFEKKKRFGQHFLKDIHVCEKMVRAGNLSKKDIVLEVGPGEGVLTFFLLKAGAYVIAIEKDCDLIPLLTERFKKEIKTKQLKLIEGDIRDLSLTKLGLKKGTYKVIANIPYYISGLLFRFFLENTIQPNTLVFLVQKEVGERITKKNSKENMLSLSVKVYGEPSYISTVKRGAFAPPPKVDSAILAVQNISRKNFSNKAHEKRFFEIIKKAFNASRKQLGHTLKGDIAVLRSLEGAEIDLKKRPEDLSLQTWLKVSKT